MAETDLVGQGNRAAFGAVPHEFPTLFRRPDQTHETLYVLTVCWNFARFRSRWRLFEDFQLHMQQSGVVLYIAEVALGARDFVVTEAGNPQHLQLRTHHEVWVKENALNLLAQRLPPDWTKVAWVDADIRFLRPDWANETLHVLEHYPMAQLWSQAHDLTSDYELTRTTPDRSFVAAYHARHDVPWAPVTPPPSYYYGPSIGGVWGHTGLAWAARREWWDGVGGLYDMAILGSGDWYMAFSMLGDLHHLHGLMRSALAPSLRAWEARTARSRWAERPLQHNLGLVPGLIVQYNHGTKADRRYESRDQILINNHFEPIEDLKRDSQGLWELTDRNPQLRRDIQRYFAARREDG